MLRIYCKDRNCKPTRQYLTDAGLDLKADDNYFLSPGETTKVNTGLHVEIPIGYVGLVFARSGLACKYGITLSNCVGIIDSDYRGEIICSLECHTSYRIDRYDRIAQLIIVPCFIDKYSYVNKLSDLTSTNRGIKGFGSTGND